MRALSGGSCGESGPGRGAVGAERAREERATSPEQSAEESLRVSRGLGQRLREEAARRACRGSAARHKQTEDDLTLPAEELEEVARLGAALPPCSPWPTKRCPGQFILADRGTDHDELLMAAQVPGHLELVCRTTAGDGSAFGWVVADLRAGRMSLPMAELLPHVRRAGPGVDEEALNWICMPPIATDQWTLTYGEMQALVQEGQASAQQGALAGMPATSEVFVAGGQSQMRLCHRGQPACCSPTEAPRRGPLSGCQADHCCCR